MRRPLPSPEPQSTVSEESERLSTRPPAGTEGGSEELATSKGASLAARTRHLDALPALPGISPTSWERMSKSAACAFTNPVTESTSREPNHINTIDDPTQPQTVD
jgi:hypothetical protein